MTYNHILVRPTLNGFFDLPLIFNKLSFNISIKISNLFIGFCTFYLSCPIYEKDNFLENV